MFAEFRCCGVRVAARGPTEASALLLRLSLSGHGYGVHLCNAYTLALAASDGQCKDTLNGGDISLADGTPLFGQAGAQGIDPWAVLFVAYH